MSDLAKILLVDDNPKYLADVLPFYGYDLKCVSDGVQALSVLDSGEFFDIVLLDVMMPNMNGWDTLKTIRKNSKTKDIPVIMLTAVNEDQKMISGLKIGADDYIVKPFSPSEVMARIRAILRRVNRGNSDDKNVLNISTLQINIEEYSLSISGKKIPLTKKEIETMWILAGNPNKVFTRDNLLDSLWGQDYFGDSRTVDSHIKRLRAKLDKVDHPNWEIKTIWGMGYKFEINV